jgi:uncharacterized protein involved in exopolysaccharide biosynthesis
MDPYLEEEQSAGTGFDPLVLWRIFLRRKWLFIIPFVLCSAMAAVVIRFQTPIYFTRGQIHVIFEATSARNVPEVTRYGGRRQRDRDYQVQTTIEIIVTGPKFLEGVIRELLTRRPDMVEHPALVGAVDVATSPEVSRAITALARQLRHKIQVKSDGPSLYSLGVRDTDPERAYVLTQIVIDHFLEEERATRLQPATTARDFLERQYTEIEQDLIAAQRKLNEFQRSLLSESLAGNPINEINLVPAETALSGLRTEFYSSVRTELIESEQAVRSLLGSLPSSADLPRNADIASSLRQLTDLEFEDSFTLSGSGEGLDRESDLGSLRIHLNTLLEGETVRKYPQLGLMARNRVTRYLYLVLYQDVRQQVISKAENYIGDYRDFRTRQPEQSAELSQLQHDVEMTRETLNSIRSDIAQENIRLEASMSEIGYKVVVRRDPLMPLAPIEPNRMKLYFMGFVFALAIGGGLVILAQLLDRSFHSVTDIERVLGLVVIGTLPVIENDYFQKRRIRKVWIWVLLIIITLALAAAGFQFIYPALA